MLRVAHQVPHCTIPYITNSRPQAKRIAWKKLLFWDRTLGLGMKFNHADLTATIPRVGSTIFLGGANDEAEIERYRGGDHPLIVLDEAQSLRSFLPYFISDILLPTLVDHDGQLVLIGTPNAACLGYFHDASNPEAEQRLLNEDGEPMFSVHNWTGFDNPNLDPTYKKGEHNNFERALSKVAEVIRRICRAGGISQTSNTYQREWLGKWVFSLDGLVFQVKPYNIVQGLPEGLDDLRYVLGMDVGYVDATAFVIMAYSETAGAAFAVESYEKTEMLPSQQSAEVQRLAESYEFESIVIDSGGGGKGLVEELAQRHDLPAKLAAKREKVAAINTLNGDLKSNTLRILRYQNSTLIEHLYALKWDVARLRRRGGKHWALKSINHLAIDDSTPDHLPDAFLYAHRECLHYMNGYQKEGPAPGSKAWVEAEEEAMFQKVAGKVEDQETPWWDTRPQPSDEPWPD